MKKDEPITKLLKAIFEPKEKSPNLGSRRMIKKYHAMDLRKYAIWHKDKGLYLDKEGNSYKEEELV